MGKYNLLKIGNVAGMPGDNVNHQYHQLMHHHPHNQPFRINPSAIFAVAANNPNTLALHTNLIPKSMPAHHQATGANYYQATNHMTNQVNFVNRNMGNMSNNESSGNKIRFIPSSNSTSPHSSTSVVSPSQSPELMAAASLNLTASSTENSSSNQQVLNSVNKIDSLESTSDAVQSSSGALNEGDMEPGKSSNAGSDLNSDENVQNDLSKVKLNFLTFEPRLAKYF